MKVDEPAPPSAPKPPAPDRSPSLVLLTHAFPFGHGEQFLETEVPYLARRFRLTIVPTVVFGPRRALPEGVVVDTSLADSRRAPVRRIGSALAACVRSTLFHRELLTHPRLLWQWKGLTRLVVHHDNARRVYRWICRYIEDNRPDLSRTLFYTYWLVPLCAGIGLARRHHPGIRLVSRAHRHDLYEEASEPPYIPFREETLRAVDLLVAIAEHGRRYLIEHYPDGVPPLEVSRLGVHDPQCTALSSSDSGLRLVSCSFMEPVKRLDLLIEGLGMLGQRRPETAVEWHHIGDGPLRAALEGKARRLLPTSVRWFFHGRLSNREVFEFYRTRPVDVFVNVSESEGIPVSIMEAQSCGIPVIAPAVGGIPEIVNSANGILLDQDPSPAAVAEALEVMVSSPALVSAKRIASKDTWRSLYRAESNYAPFADRLLGLLDRDPRPAGP